MKKPTKPEFQIILDQAMQINKQCPDSCYDFTIMISEFHKDTLILRWLEIDISAIDAPIQCYRYRCFDPDGSPQHCSIHYSDQQEANTFFKSLKPQYAQAFANDHHSPNP